MQKNSLNLIYIIKVRKDFLKKQFVTDFAKFKKIQAKHYT